ncbi:MAG: histidinol-phosphatase [Lentimicrobiaceae bacterium]|nr:histidinol-phosphatase [Lentimicrobiaceae bacterium]
MYNYHTHSRFSDGSAPAEEYVEEAILQGFKHLGFSEHSVLPFDNTFALKPENESLYCSTINELKKKYRDELQILLALEADYIPGMSEPFIESKDRLALDYVIGSVHLVKNAEGELWFIDGPRRETYEEGLKLFFNGDIRAGVKAYWHQINQMLENEVFDIVGHLDKIKMHNQNLWFKEDEPWYTGLVNETLDLVREKQVIVEVNTRGIYKGRCPHLFPGEFILRRLGEMKIPVTLSSDAHHPSELKLQFNEAVQIMKLCGLDSLAVFGENGWQQRPIDDILGRPEVRPRDQR